MLESVRCVSLLVVLETSRNAQTGLEQATEQTVIYSHSYISNSVVAGVLFSFFVVVLLRVSFGLHAFARWWVKVICSFHH